MIKTTSMSSCHWKTLVPFCLQKTWSENPLLTKLELQNHTEKQIMPFKTTVNWLFNDIWCYLVIALFDWKIDIFQQTVVTVYCILNTYFEILLLFRKYTFFKIILPTFWSFCMVNRSIANILIKSWNAHLHIALDWNNAAWPI